jgi:hypothetical protein
MSGEFIDRCGHLLDGVRDASSVLGCEQRSVVEHEGLFCELRATGVSNRIPSNAPAELSAICPWTAGVLHLPGPAAAPGTRQGRRAGVLVLRQAPHPCAAADRRARVYICAHCIRLCAEILAEPEPAQPPAS